MAAAVAGTVPRAEMQDWFAFPVYLTERVWDQLRSEDRSLAKIDSVLKHLTDLGLRHPSERTLAVVCSLVVACSTEQLAQDVAREAALLATVKSVARTNITRAKQLGTPLPGGYVNMLSRNPAEAPAGIQALFPNGYAVPRVPLEPVWERAVTWPLRDTHAAVRLARQQSNFANVSAAVSPAAIATQAALQTAQMMMTAAGGLWGNQSLDPAGLQLTPLGVEVAQRAAGQRGVEATRPSAGTGLPALLDRASQQVPVDSARRQEPQIAVPPIVGPSAEAPVTCPSAEVLSAAVVSDGSGPQPDSVLDDSVSRLAQVHYGEELKDISPGTAKKPAAAKSTLTKLKKSPPLKKPAASTKMNTMKRPSAQGVMKQQALKRPAAKAQDLTRVEAASLRPNGCGKCRHQTGCTPSCWRLRGRNLID